MKEHNLIFKELHDLTNYAFVDSYIFDHSLVHKIPADIKMNIIIIKNKKQTLRGNHLRDRLISLRGEV
jgi:hypothetical protein